MSTKITEALAKFAAAIEALKDAGIITSTDKILEQQQDAPVETQGTSTVVTIQPEASAAPSTPVVPKRGSGGRFLKRDGSPGTSKVTKVIEKEVSKRVIAPDLVDDFVAWFFKTPQEGLYNVKCGQYECRRGDATQKTAHTLIFYSSAKKRIWTEAVRGEAFTVVPKDANNIIGIRPIDSKIGVFNSSRLLYGNNNAAQLRPQVAAEKAGAVPIPFENVVSRSGGAGMDLSKLEIVDWRGTEQLIIPPVARGRQWTGNFYVIRRHFAGAVVVRVEDKYFLFDTDREEVNNFGFNPFFTQLPGPAKTVHEAYDLLMPESVKQAINEGREVKRQGEFFFIPLTRKEIMGYVVGANVDHVSDYKTVCSFIEAERRLNDIGAAYFNWLQHGRLYEVDNFIKRCDEHTGGLLPETPVTADATQEIKAMDLLKPLTEQLVQRVGTPLAQGMLGDTDIITELWKLNYVLHQSNFGPARTHLATVASDLQFDCRVDVTRDSGGTETITPVGIYAKRFGIMFNLRIGEASAANDWRQRQHRATAVMKSTYITGDILAIGTIVHEGRDHAPLYLACWHRVVGNTATNNWTVSGSVD